MAISAEELLAQVHNLYAALNEKRSFSRYREHVQKLGVAAGDHCLYTDKVEPGRRVSVTSVCSLAECADVDLVTLARGFMHNIFEVGRYLEPGEDETTCAEGLWILGPGEYMQACFEGVPAGCDLHLFASGSYMQAISFLFGLPAMITAEEEEEVAITGFLWYCDYGLPQIIKAAASDGTVVGSWASPGTNPQGLSHDGTYLWHCDWNWKTIFQLDPSDMSVINSWYGPFTYVSGLVHDGTYMWICRMFPNKIYKLDPSDMSVIASWTSPGGNPSGLAYDGTYLWHCDWYTDKIYKLDPSDMSVIASWDSPAAYPSGISHDGTYLWVCDEGTDKIYMLDPSDCSVIASWDTVGDKTAGISRIFE